MEKLNIYLLKGSVHTNSNDHGFLLTFSGILLLVLYVDFFATQNTSKGNRILLVVLKVVNN